MRGMLIPVQYLYRRQLQKENVATMAKRGGETGSPRPGWPKIFKEKKKLGLFNYLADIFSHFLFSSYRIFLPRCP